jgi:hypothetical protein
MSEREQMARAAQLRAARALMGWSSRKLAAIAGIGSATVTRMENGTDARGTVRTMEAARTCLEGEGVAFHQDGDRIGVSAPIDRCLIEKRTITKTVLASACTLAFAIGVSTSALMLRPEPQPSALDRVVSEVDATRTSEDSVLSFATYQLTRAASFTFADRWSEVSTRKQAFSDKARHKLDDFLQVRYSEAMRNKFVVRTAIQSAPVIAAQTYREGTQSWDIMTPIVITKMSSTERVSEQTLALLHVSYDGMNLRIDDITIGDDVKAPIAQVGIIQ